MINVGSNGLPNGFPVGSFGVAGKDQFSIKLGHLQGSSFERSGDVTYDSVVYGANEPISVDGKYVHHGQRQNVIPNTDLETWAKIGTTVSGSVVTATDNLTARISIASLVLEIGEVYTIDINVGALSVSGTGMSFRVVADSNLTTINFTPEANKTTSLQYIADGIDAEIYLYLVPSENIGDFIDCSITMVKSKYSISPFYIPTSGTPASIDTAASTADPDKHGLNWDLTAVDNSWLLDLLTSTGTLILNNINIIPTKTEWQTAGQLNILSGATGNQILYVDTDGFIKATDGTNTCISPAEYVAGVDTDISLIFGGGNMQIMQDGTLGGSVSFVGTFAPGDTLKLAYENEDIMNIGDIAGKPYLSYSTASPAKGVIGV